MRLTFFREFDGGHVRSQAVADSASVISEILTRNFGNDQSADNAVLGSILDDRVVHSLAVNSGKYRQVSVEPFDPFHRRNWHGLASDFAGRIYRGRLLFSVGEDLRRTSHEGAGPGEDVVVSGHRCDALVPSDRVLIEAERKIGSVADLKSFWSQLKLLHIKSIN